LDFGLFSSHEGFYKLLFPVINLTLLLNPVRLSSRFFLKNPVFLPIVCFLGKYLFKLFDLKNLVMNLWIRLDNAC